ncbi:hypothetical protein K1T71_009484 [Dendrolimus kikuchii]|uniref:Uncharacterized protein n=1 Tax=Dendrolimus kikuchii TaxID=765133 RepID=A0ACC1CUN4_9NEOP|nr:hypothetical protein K1T71_009484 [Dendrolimus kikuchii]
MRQNRFVVNSQFSSYIVTTNIPILLHFFKNGINFVRNRAISVCQQHILRYFSHIARKNPDNMEGLMVTRKVEGKRPRGRSPNRWIDQIADQLDTSINSAFHRARNRSRWKRAIVHCHQSHDP